MLEPEDINQLVSIVVTTPDGKRHILSVIFWEQSSQASCRQRFWFLASLPRPQPAILDGRSEWLWQC